MPLLPRPTAFCFLALLFLCGGLSNGRTQGFIAPPPPPGITIGGVSGNLKDLTVKFNAGQDLFHLSAMALLKNNTGTVLKNITAAVYVSDHETLGSSDLKLATVRLAGRLPDGKMGRNEKVSVPISRKISPAVAPFYKGKYLLVVIMDQYGTSLGALPAAGPIKLR